VIHTFVHCPGEEVWHGSNADTAPVFKQQVEIEISGEQMTVTTLPHPEDPEGELMWSVTLTKQ
jgi:hypothetical protein